VIVFALKKEKRGSGVMVLGLIMRGLLSLWLFTVAINTSEIVLF